MVNVVKRFAKDGQPYTADIHYIEDYHYFTIDASCYEEVDEEIDRIEFETLEEAVKCIEGLGFEEVKRCKI